MTNINEQLIAAIADLESVKNNLGDTGPLAVIPVVKKCIDLMGLHVVALREQLERERGPGSPHARFEYLMNELHQRFPEVSQFSGGPPELDYLECIDVLLAKTKGK